ncbi:glycerophosphodiester phosphodiesterase [Blastococcus sp. TML/M2B]|uniref:glycerophosphodiester phosphodiesterase n=1 Tax=unclassified Blastococcus TaxID=2619396 RepID=UPI00190B975B|nr:MULTISPECIES: glycerophosphodiester phosphodiesterase family protein [unclassified Blastococcus]MBN1091225.1 glycerophosphodiester phosphodiesterase [Blastococcus sp. TML/M2B]MBN1095220.1 glycerophosphodiester phosphodiesterase [Blastococcus sp. TML/C7B]
MTAVEVVAHRGATAEAPEHTLAAYRQAAAVGADAVECDVRLTRDGVLVCVHDRQIRRTSNGRGVVSALHLEELEQYQFGARKPRGRSRWADDEILSVTDEPDLENGLVLTLDRLLEYITATPGSLRLAIETKHPTRHTRKVEEALVESLRRYGLLTGGRPVEWAGRPAVRMMSFSQLAVRRMAELAPGIPTVQLIGKRLRPVRRELLQGNATALGPAVAVIRADPGFVADAHAAGKQVHVWTVNKTADMDLMRELGVDAVITDHPDEMLRRLGRGTSAAS